MNSSTDISARRANTRLVELVGAFGRYRKTAAMAAASYVGDSPLFLFDYLLRLARVVVLLSLWRMIFSGTDGAAGLTLSAILTYTIVSEILADQLSPRTELDLALWDGSIATRFLRPLGIVGIFASEMAGRWAFTFCSFSLPLLLISPLLGLNPLPSSASAAVLFVPSLIVGIAVGLAIDFIFGGLIVALDQPVWTIRYLRQAVTALLSGALLPLAVYPWGIGEVFGWLPFASTASAPLRIYTETGDPTRLIAIQAIWCAILWPIALWIWRAYREKLVAYGG